MIKGFLHICILVLVGISAFGQTFSLVTASNKILIGDQVQTSLRLTYPANISPNNVTYPKLVEGESLNDTVDLIKLSPTKTSTTTNNSGTEMMVWQQDFLIGIYGSGNIQIGPFLAVIDGDTIRSNVATIAVEAPEIDEEKGFIGIKDIDTDPFTFWERIMLWIKENWIALVIFGVFIVGGTILAIFLSRKPDKEIPKGPVVPLPVQWMAKLESIEKEQLWQNGKHKIYYSEVTEIIRRYIEYKFEVHALEQTSDEIIQALKLSSIDTGTMNQIQNLFKLADLIKFAKSTPLPQENEAAMKIAKSLIQKEINASNV